MASESENHREEGVNFDEVDPVLEDLDYPVSKEKLVSEHGDVTLERTSADKITVRELFADMGETEFESAEDIRQFLLNMMPKDSEGRQRYSDRGGSMPDEATRDEDFDKDETL